MKKLLVILGPTSAGKTDLAINLARKLNGELVSCDSSKVYTGLDIGTGKMPDELNDSKLEVRKYKNYWQLNEIKIWLYDMVSPKKQYTVAEYIRNANHVIRDIQSREKLPIIVGGTGLYL